MKSSAIRPQTRPPLRVLVDGRLRVPLEAAFFQAGPALVATDARTRIGFVVGQRQPGLAG